MKRSNLFPIILLIFCVHTMPSLAQNAVSIRVGINFGKWMAITDGLEKYDYYDTYHAFPLISVPIEFDLSKKWTIQVEPSLLRKGAKIDYIENKQSNRCIFKVTYIELPLLLKFRYAKFNMLLGPSIGYATGGRIKESTLIYSSNKFPIDKKVNFDEEKYPRKDVSLNGGLGLNFDRSGFDVRYTLSLTNLGIKGDGNAKYYNQGIQLAYTYCLGINRKVE